MKSITEISGTREVKVEVIILEAADVNARAVVYLPFTSLLTRW